MLEREKVDYNMVYAEVFVALSELTLTGTIVKDQVQARDRYFNNHPDTGIGQSDPASRRGCGPS